MPCPNYRLEVYLLFKECEANGLTSLKVSFLSIREQWEWQVPERSAGRSNISSKESQALAPPLALRGVLNEMRPETGTE